MKKRGILSKAGIMEYHDLGNKEYINLETQGLVPNYTEEAWGKFNTLMERGGPFNFDERFFLGNMDIKAFGLKYPVEVEEFMAD